MSSQFVTEARLKEATSAWGEALNDEARTREDRVADATREALVAMEFALEATGNLGALAQVIKDVIIVLDMPRSSANMDELNRAIVAGKEALEQLHKLRANYGISAFVGADVPHGTQQEITLKEGQREGDKVFLNGRWQSV